MELDKEKALKLVIVVLATLAALAVMSTLVQLIQTVLPFIIVGAGIYVGYRWALGDAPAPTADEVEEQARGIFGRFRRTKQAVETTMKVGEALGDLGVKSEKREKNEATVVKGEATKVDRAEITAEATADVATSAGAAPKKEGRKERRRRRNQTQQKDKAGAIEFKDSDVVISAGDVVLPDTSRLEEKEKEAPSINDAVLAQIEERRRRLEGGQ